MGAQVDDVDARILEAVVDQQQRWKPQWTRGIESVTLTTACALGFQLMNASMEEAQGCSFTPATAKVAADHLGQMLRGAVSRCGEDVPADRRLVNAVQVLHTQYFGKHSTYRRWLAAARLRDGADPEAAFRGQPRLLDTSKAPSLSKLAPWLAELSLFFLLWTEAANLRHTPELLCLLYHLAANSTPFSLACTIVGQDSNFGPLSLRYWLDQEDQALKKPSLYDELLKLRGEVAGRVPFQPRERGQRAIGWDTLLVGAVGGGDGELQPVSEQQGNDGSIWGPKPPPVPQLGDSNPVLLQTAALQALLDSEPLRARRQDRAKLPLLLLQMFGDGNIFLDLVLQPLFNFVAEQVGLMGGAKEEPALRIGYDDMNECVCNPQTLLILSKLLSETGTNITKVDKAWEALVHKAYSAEVPGNSALPELGSMTCGDGSDKDWKRYPRDRSRWDRLEELEPGVVAPQLGKSLMVMHQLWGRVFRKTFIETRSMGAVWVTFNRLYVLHATMLACMVLWAYFIPNWSITAMFSPGFWTQQPTEAPGSIVAHPFTIPGTYDSTTPVWKVLAWCSAASLIAHAAIHLTKNITQLALLDRPRAVRKGSTITVARDRAAVLRSKAALDALLWLGIVALLCDAFLAGPVAKLLVRKVPKLFSKVAYWVLVALVYVGARAVIKAYVMGVHLLPRGMREGLQCGPLARRSDHAHNADFMYKYKYLRASQGTWRYLVNMGLWLIILITKFLFDFFVVVRPVATGPLYYLISRTTAALADPASTPLLTGAKWSEVVGTGILSLVLVFAAGLLTWYDTGLYYQLWSALYSSVVLALPRRIGLIKDWVDLVAAFPRLPSQVGDKLLGRKDPAAFASLWNAIVDDLRQRDLISDTERRNLAYEVVKVPVRPSQEQQQQGQQQQQQQKWTTAELLLLPRLVTAGKIAQAKQRRGTSLAQQAAVDAAWEQLVEVLEAMGLPEIEAGKMRSNQQQSNAVSRLAKRGEVLLRHKDTLAKLLEEMHFKIEEVYYNQAEEVKVEVYRDPKGPNAKPVVEVELQMDQDADDKFKGKLQLLPGQYMKCYVADGVRSPEEPLTVEPAKVPRQLLKPLLEDLLGGRQFQGDVEKTLNAMGMPTASQSGPIKQVLTWLLDSMSLDQGSTFPESAEAQRVLTFWASSLFNPNMPAAPDLLAGPSMTTLTPHYEEDVLYGLDPQWVAEQVPGARGLKHSTAEASCLIDAKGNETETLKYLRISFKKEWANFTARLQRMEAEQPKLDNKGAALLAQDPTHISASHFRLGAPLAPYAEEVLVWASMRGQLLTRTVCGMMYYQSALEQLITKQRQGLREALRKVVEKQLTAARVPCSSEEEVAAFKARTERLVAAAVTKLASSKYSYVVSSQVLGEMQSANDLRKRWLADAIRCTLLRRFPALRVAYMDLENLEGPRPPPPAAAADGGTQSKTANDPKQQQQPKRNRTKDPKKAELLRQYSVLLVAGPPSKQGRPSVLERYRVRLPMNVESAAGVVCGEGKPENQNHAVIFCHGETLQTIDCNQDGYLAEALKLPNLLAEFTGNSRMALVGFREWVFSEDSGALAVFAASTERSFGTTVQRVMNNPGGVRFHYGHPDVWNKTFTMTSGGVSKANKGLHVSEDVFGGYNVMLRGWDITYVDYHAVGKGRDMGFEMILGFEAKIAAGNGEQVISRDVSRLGVRMNIWRLASWYHSGNGFFINSALLMFSLLVNAWMLLLLGLSGVTGDPVMRDRLAFVGLMQMLQLGSLSLLVYVLTVWVEAGLLAAAGNVVRQTLAGSPLFYVFRAQTSHAAFTTDLKFGGAQYIATGRGYKLRATPFVNLFQSYVRSHMWFGGHLLLVLVVALLVGTPVSAAALWSYWLVVLALLVAPFWFNPFAFDWSSNKVQAAEWVEWMLEYRRAGKMGPHNSPQLWREWNDDRLAPLVDRDGKQLGRKASCAWSLLWSLPVAVITGYAMVGMFARKWWIGCLVVVLLNVLLLALVVVGKQLQRLSATNGASVAMRFCSMAVKVLLLAGVVTLFGFIASAPLMRQMLVPVVAKLVLIEFELARFVCMVLVVFLPANPLVRQVVDHAAWAADMAMGLLLLLVLFVGSLFGILTRFQATVLFSEGYASNYLTEKALRGTEVERVLQETRALQREELEQQLQQQQHKGSSSAPQGPAYVHDPAHDAGAPAAAAPAGGYGRDQGPSNRAGTAQDARRDRDQRR